MEVRILIMNHKDFKKVLAANETNPQIPMCAEANSSKLVLLLKIVSLNDPLKMIFPTADK